MQCPNPNCKFETTGTPAFCPKCGTIFLSTSGSTKTSGLGKASGVLTGQTGALSGTQKLHQPAVLSAPLPQTPGQNISTQQLQSLGQLIHQYPGAKRPRLFDTAFRMHCPFCNASFHPSDCAVHAAMRYDENQPLDSQMHAAPQGDFNRLFSRLYTRKLEGEVNMREDARRQCPTCKKLLPYRLEIDACFTIAIVGNGASGKSHYLAALLHQLKNEAVKEHTDVYVEFEALTPETEEQLTRYRNILFKNKAELRANIRKAPDTSVPFIQHEPLIFRLRIVYNQGGQKIHSAMNLVFYDLAGEDIAQADALKLYGWPIMEAQAVIHVADPLEMPHILEKLPDALPQVSKAKTFSDRGKTHEVLSSVVKHLQRKYKQNMDQDLQTPVAIMLSKSDIIDSIAAQYGFENARFLTYPVYDGRINVEDLQIVDREVRRFLSDMQETDLLRTSNLLSDVSFFAASATGCPPDQHGHYAAIKPRRCLDPLFWLLGRLTAANAPRKR